MRKINISILFLLAFLTGFSGQVCATHPSKKASSAAGEAEASAERWRGYPEGLARHLSEATLQYPSGKAGKFSGSGHTLLVFAGSRCPLAAKYVGKLNALQNEFREPLSLQVIAVFSNRGETPSDLKTFAQHYSPGFALLLDAKQKIADTLNAERTPEAFLLDPQFKLVYRGAIDDQLKVRGSLPEVKNDYVRDVLLSLANAEPIRHSVTEVEGCFISREGLQDSYPTYARDIGPLIEKHCTYCHRAGDVGAFLPLVDFASIAQSAETLTERVTERVMPPWRLDGRFGVFHNDQRLDINEIWAIRNWSEQGTPMGVGEFKMKSAQDGSKYRLPDADAVIHMTEDDAVPLEYTVPATGVLPYQHFRVQTDFGEDKWLVASEIRALAPEVVHHINVFLIPPQNDFVLRNPRALAMAKMIAKRRFNVDPEEFEWVYRIYGPGMRRQLFLIGNYTPSHTALHFPAEHGVLIPRGSEVIFECHYTPNGKQTLDRSALALKFAKTVPPNAQGMQSITRSGSPPLAALQMAPGEKKQLTRTLTFFADAKLFSLRPHMHLRGRNFKAVVVRPGAEPETVLYVPEWDYEWQIAYSFKVPLKMPKGSKLHMIYEWDNSKENKWNPDPTAEVRFGTQIKDEMGMAWPTYAYENPAEVEEAEVQLEDALSSTSEESQ